MKQLFGNQGQNKSNIGSMLKSVLSKSKPKKKKKRETLPVSGISKPKSQDIKLEVNAGVEAKATATKNCLSCTQFMTCKDAARSFQYVCTKFKKMPVDSIDDLLANMAIAESSKSKTIKTKKPSNELENELDFDAEGEVEDEQTKPTKTKEAKNVGQRSGSHSTKNVSSGNPVGKAGKQNFKASKEEKEEVKKSKGTKIEVREGKRPIDVASPRGSGSAVALIVPSKKPISIWDNIFSVEASGSEKEKREMEFDLENAVEKFLDVGNPLPKDLRIDDGDFPLANNFYEFTTTKDFMDYRLYFKQMEVSLKYLSEYCPYCTNMDWWMSDELEVDTPLEEIPNNVQLFHKGVCPDCGITKSECIQEGSLNDYEVMAGLVGQRGGKSAVSAILLNYLLHNYLKIQNPPQTFELLPNSPLIGTLVALTYKQIVETIWEPFKEALDSSPWFSGYNEMLAYHANKYSEPELFAIKEMFIRYKHRQMLIYPSGPNKRTLRGRSRFCSVVDEIGWFDANNAKLVKTNAEEVYTALARSLSTIRRSVAKLRTKGVNHILMPFSLNVSSPSEKADMIMKLYNQSIRSKTIFGFKYATWEFNPNMPREALEDEFRLNPISAERDYGANPPNSASPFIRHIEEFNNVFKKEQGNAAKLVQTVITTGKGKKFTSARADIFCSSDSNRIMSLDAGVVNNHFAIVIGRNSVAGRPVIDFMDEIIPQQDKPISLHHVVQNVVFPLIEEFNVKLVVSDRWQSLKTMSDIQAVFEDVATDTKSLKAKNFVTFRELIHSGGILFPKPEVTMDELKDMLENMDTYPMNFKNLPIAHFLGQCLFSHFSPDTTKPVQKGTNRTDDILYAATLAATYLLDPVWADYLRGEEIVQKRPEALGVINRKITSRISKATSFSLGSNTGGCSRLTGIAAMQRSVPLAVGIGGNRR